MAINWGKTWSQLNDEEALKSRKATGGIDWDTTRKHIEKEQVEAHQAEVKAAVQASKQQEKLKQRKLQTAPFAARAAETLAGLQEGSEIQKLHPTGGPLSVSQDTLRDLGMVNENGFVLGGVDPGKLGLDAADMAKLGLPASSVAASGGATFPAKAGKAGVFGGRDYAGYLAGEFGAGMMSSPSGIMGGATTAIGDLATGGQVSAGAQTLANYFAQKPQMLQRWMTNEIGVEQMIMNETGVSAAALAAYRAANTDDWLHQSLREDRGHNLEQGFKNVAGDIAYTLGQQAPGFVYSMGAPAADGGGILSSVASAIKNKSGVGRALASSTKGALKGNVNTWLMGAGAAGNQLTELAKQRGYDPANYINAMGNGFVEYISEGLLGFSDGGSIKALWRATGSKTGNTLKSVARWLMSSAEEGLEEVINVPMSGIVDKMTVDPDKKLVGEGGIFDLKEMLRAGIMGATVGMIMGGVGAVSSIHSAVLEGASIFDAATATNHLIDTIPKDMRPAHIDPKTATAEMLEQKQAEVLDALEHMVDTATVDAFEQGAEQAVQRDAQAAPQMQTEAVQNNEQSVDIKQEALNNEQTEILSGRGPQRGPAPIDAGSAGQVERAGTAAAARRNQQQIAQRRTSVAEQNGLRRVSSRELGLDMGTDLRRNVVLEDESLWDDELRSIKKNWDDMNRRRREKYGYTQDMELKFVLSKMQVRDADGADVLVDGVVNDDGGVCVCVNSMTRSATEIAEHEFFHTMEADTPELVDALWPAVESVGLNDAMVQRYRRFYSETLGYSERMVRAEILADAYAGLERIQGTEMQTVKDMVRQLTGEAQEAIERGWYTPAAEETYESVDGEGRETRGPPTYSVAETEDGRMVAVVESDILANIDTSNWTDKVKKEAKSAAKKALLNFKDGVDVEGKTVKVNKRSRDEYTRSNDAERLHRQNRDAYADKMRAAANVDDILKATAFGEPDGGLKHKRSDNFVDFVRGDVLIEAGTNQYEAQTVVGITDGGEYVFYDVVDIEPTTFIKTKEPSTAAASKNAASAIQESSFDQSVPQGATVVKARFSASDEVDSEGNELSVEQAEFFAESKVRDENGDLMVVYHGSGNQFTVFSHDFISLHGSAEGQGFYFTDKKEMAEGYERQGGSLFVGYLNITKPLSDSERTIKKNELKKLLKAIDPTGDDVVINYASTSRGYPSKAWYTSALEETVSLIWGSDKTDSEVLAEIAAAGAGPQAVMEQARAVLGYDGYIVADKYDDATVYVAFESNQFKNIDNRTPTSDPDIRYSMAEEDAEGNELSVEQAEFFRDSKVRVDEYGDYGEQDGSLVPVYHATWNDEFTVFDAGRLGEYTDKNAMDDWFAATAHVGFWFNTQDLSELKKVGKRSEKVYLNIKRPYRAGTLDGLAEDIATWTEDYIEEDTPAERGRAFAKWLEWNGYDGVMLNDEELGGVSFVALYPEQIKRVSNTRPTEAADIRYSVASESDAEQEDTERTRRDLTPGQELSRKEQSVIKRAINSSRMQMRDIIPAGTKEAREVQQMQILDLARKLWENGEITQTDIDEAYEEIWSKGAIVDRELADEYAELRADLKAGVTVSEELKRDITDYEKFRRANIGTLVMRNGEESDIAVRYRDWARDYPNFFPESIMEPADMLERAAEVAQMLKPTVKTMSELSRSGRDYDYESLKADFTDMVRTMELEILHPVQEITKKKKDQKEAERVASFRQIYKEVMDEVFKVKQRETFEPNPEYWHEVADDAWERMNERAEAIQTEWLRSLTKEGFKGTESLDELGVRIAGSVADYHLVGQVLENHRAAQAIQRDIKKAETKLKATAKEKQYAAGIVSGTFSEADITGDARPHVVLELADYYMMERTVGMDLINERRNDMYAEADYQVENLMQDKDAYKVSSSPVLFYRTPQRNMIRMYGREQGQKIYDFLFAPVEENEAERIRWVNKMYDEVRLVEGENGKRKPLNRKERALVQMVMEGRAAAEVVAAMEERQVVYDAANNLRNGQAIEDVVREFNLNKELSEAATGYATWLDTNDILQTTKGVDLKRIENAVELYAKQYNRFYKAINDFLAAHGYEPIGFIKGYAPHIQPEGTRNLLQSTLKMMGLSEGVTTLPASIAGRTHTYRPNKRWNPYFLSRHGDTTEYDVTAGYESYVDYLSDILYHTDDTVRIRRAANYFRRTYAPDETSNNLSWAEGLRNASPEQKAEMLREQGKLKYTDAPSAEVTNELFDEYVSELYDNIKGQGKYSNFVNWLEDFANQLTGKQSLADRGMEVLTGRQSLNFANKLNRAFQRANVAGNLSTAFNQTAQVPMIVADIGNVNTLLALKDYAVGKVRRDGFKEKSDFLTARKGMNNLVVDPADRVINIMFKPAQVADDLVSTIAARGAYIKAVRQGMSDAEAMKYADRKAEQIMGSRAKGSAPQAFRSKNPLVRMVNMFQIEALNAFEYVEQDVIIQGIKDIKQIDDSKGRAKATAALIGLLGKMLVAAFLWNRTTEELYGGSPAQFDLLGYAANFLASGNGLTANEQLLDWIDMAWERAFGEPLFDIDPDYNEEFDWKNATGDLGYAIGSDIPFVRNIAGMLGIGDQSLPMPDLSTVYDAGRSLMSNGASPETLDAALTAAGQFLPGGRQINKTYQGARTMIRGGRYYGYGENERLQYPVEDTTSNWIKALLFGPSGLSETAEFYAAGGDDGLSAGNTRKYQELMQVGMSAEMAMEVYEEYRRINRLETMTASEKATEFANTLYEMGVPEDQAELAREAFQFWGMVPGEATKYDTFVEGGLEPDMAYELTETLGELEPEDGKTSVSNLQKYQAVLEMTDVESTRYAALAGLMPDKELARLRAAYDYVQSGTYVEFLTAFDETYPGESKSQDRVETVLKQMRLDNEERAALWQMCGPKWKTDNNPFSKTVGREVARLIEEYYAEIDGE